MTEPAQLSLFFPALNLALHGLSDEVGSLLALVQNGVDTVNRALGKPSGGLLVVDLFPAHPRYIDDITNCYKGYFTRYLLLQSSRLLISSKTSKREQPMTFFSQIDPSNTRRFAGPQGQVLAIYDQCRTYTLYSEVGHDGRSVCFVSAPRSYFSDEVEEIH